MSKRRSAILALVFLCFVSCSKRAQETERATVSVPVLNMYSKANTDADVVSQAIYGMPVSILEQNAAWARIKTPDDYTGWAEAAAIRRVTAGESPYASKGRVATVESLFAHLYREPSVTKHKPLLSVPFDSKLELVGEKDDESERWFQVRLVNGSKAWVQHGDVTLDPAARTISELIELHRRFLGLPYTWGGIFVVRLRLLRFHADAVPPRRRQHSARRRRAGRVERHDRKSRRMIFSPEICCISASPCRRLRTPVSTSATASSFTPAPYTHPVIQISKLEEPHWAERYVGARRWKQ